jgi:hypothetical protein
MITKTREARTTMTIGQLFSLLGVPETEHASFQPNFPLSVLGDKGYYPIRKLFRTHSQNSATLTTENGCVLKCGHDHQLMTTRGWVKSHELQSTDEVITKFGPSKIISCVVDETVKPLYDISVEEVHSYYSSDILSHNSWALATIGANALRAGKKVVHYTLELNENYVGLRYDTIYTGIEPGKIPENPQLIHDLVEQIKGEIIIKYYPARTITSHTIQAHIQQMASLGFKPDLIIVDYADLMSATARTDARYQELGAVYEELRGLAGELQIPIWTASQTQRSALQDEVIQADKIAESYSKIMTADLVLSISRKLEDKVNKTGRAHIIKNRFGADGQTFPMIIDAGVGKIEIFDENSAKGVMLKKQMENGEVVTKQNLAKKLLEMNLD